MVPVFDDQTEILSLVGLILRILSDGKVDRSEARELVEASLELVPTTTILDKLGEGVMDALYRDDDELLEALERKRVRLIGFRASSKTNRAENVLGDAHRIRGKLDARGVSYPTPGPEDEPHPWDIAPPGEG